MLNNQPKLYVSPALCRLRTSVVAVALVLGLCLVLHMFVYAFVHFTDLRWTTLGADNARANTQVILAHSDESALKNPEFAARLAEGGAPPDGKAVVTADVNQVLSRNDYWFESITGLANTAGGIAALALVIFMFQGVSIAAGAAVPGVERAVSASSWAVILALLALPISDVFPSFPFGGAFAPYEQITQTSEMIIASDAGAISGFQFFAERVLMPLALLAGAVVMVLRFNTGIEKGAIATSMSELDEQLEKEMASIKLVSTGSTRAGGALNHAIGEPPADRLSPSLLRGANAGPGSSKPKKNGASNAPDAERRIGAPNPGDPMARPI